MKKKKQNKNFYLIDGGDITNSLTKKQIIELAQKGVIRETTQLKSAKNNICIPAKEIKWLKSHFHSPIHSDNPHKAINSFLNNLLSSLDSRRSAIDTRCSVVLAISTFALVTFLSQMKKQEFLYPSSYYLKVTAFSVIIFFLLSAFLSLRLIAPIPRRKKARKTQHKDFSWFYLIANRNNLEYYNDVTGLNDEQIIIELSKQVVQISRLLKTRYERLSEVCFVLYVGMLFFLIHVILIFLTKYVL